MAAQGLMALNSVGFFDILLPFLLVFIIVYAILNKIEVFGPRDKTKNMNVVMGIIVGALFVAPHVFDPFGPYDLVPIILQALPQVSIVLVAVLMVLIVFGIWGSKVKLGDSSLSGIVAALSFLTVLAIFANAAWGFPDLSWLAMLGISLSPETRALIVTILVFAIIIWWVTREPKPKVQSNDSTIGKFMKGIFTDAPDMW